MRNVASMFRFVENTRVPKIVRVWLIIGLVMIFFQIIIGGVTRLTGSGLSITRWEVVTGTVPPLSTTAWQEAFDLYKATPQYQKINHGITLSEFKFIYFWEYFHRLWARLMFFVFIIPFAWFLGRGMFSRQLVPRLMVVVLLAGLEGFFGWIMVASGLIERPWVNAYNLTLHLCMALVIFSYLLWTTFIAFYPSPRVFHNQMLKRFGWILVLLTFVQIALGALMSGTKAGLFYPTWPAMQSGFMPSILLDYSQWKLDSFTAYDSNPFMPALIQFLHRNTAYLLTIMTLYFSWKVIRLNRTPQLRKGIFFMLAMLTLQVTLGILTLINCIGHIPVLLGVLHQAGAVLLLSVVLYVTYLLNCEKIQTDVENVSIA
ncbi:MAG: COX15/CtaA family protein [Lewinellaceae bacterium]|nr:COX15/CtaA family protein [Saprospiraceae bacterium]MCB9315746.1 COX15/CtaA family protein [Lewinellaceae bacterium]MCB9332425.1 COX15/CtaA family protein [Lewinellaceae bacterium]